MMERPFVLCMGGLDPSAGAGVLTDVKTVEANRGYGLGIATALTWQNAEAFEEVEWIAADKMIRMMKLLYDKHPFSVVKIGLVEDAAVLDQLIGEARSLAGEKMKIVWDPVMKASAGFDFRNKPEMEILKQISTRLTLLTPNWEEAAALGSGGGQRVMQRHYRQAAMCC